MDPAAVPTLIFAHGTVEAPAPLTAVRALSAWTFDPFLAAVIAALAAVYLYGVLRLRRRGDPWPARRTFFFIGLGLGTVVVATQSSMAVYDTTLFSAHMVQHMVLSMLVPVFLALGAPVTLALRTFPRRPRSWLKAVLHNRAVKLLTFPPVSLAIFATSMFGLYFTPWYEATLRSTYLHEMQHVHFVLVGCLFFWPLVGVDPVPGRLPHLARMGVAFLAVPIHAGLGIALMTMNTVIAAGWYLNDHHAHWVNALRSQQAGGAILWATGDMVNLVIAAAMFAQWVQADERQASRVDRRLDRAASRAETSDTPGDDELAAYNAMLARLRQGDGGASR